MNSQIVKQDIPKLQRNAEQLNEWTNQEKKEMKEMQDQFLSQIQLSISTFFQQQTSRMETSTNQIKKQISESTNHLSTISNSMNQNIQNIQTTNNSLHSSIRSINQNNLDIDTNSSSNLKEASEKINQQTSQLKEMAATQSKAISTLQELSVSTKNTVTISHSEVLQQLSNVSDNIVVFDSYQLRSAQSVITDFKFQPYKKTE